MRGLYTGILAWGCGNTGWAQRGPYKNIWGPIFPSTAQANEISWWFIIWHSHHTFLFLIFRLLRLKVHGLTVQTKNSMWQNMDHGRANQNALIYLWTTLPHNNANCQYFMFAHELKWTGYVNILSHPCSVFVELFFNKKINYISVKSGMSLVPIRWQRLGMYHTPIRLPHNGMYHAPIRLPH